MAAGWTVLLALSCSLAGADIEGPHDTKRKTPLGCYEDYEKVCLDEYRKWKEGLDQMASMGLETLDMNNHFLEGNYNHNMTPFCDLSVATTQADFELAYCRQLDYINCVDGLGAQVLGPKELGYRKDVEGRVWKLRVKLFAFKSVCAIYEFYREITQKGLANRYNITCEGVLDHEVNQFLACTHQLLRITRNKLLPVKPHTETVVCQEISLMTQCFEWIAPLYCDIPDKMGTYYPFLDVISRYKKSLALCGATMDEEYEQYDEIIEGKLKSVLEDEPAVSGSQILSTVLLKWVSTLYFLECSSR